MEFVFIEGDPKPKMVYTPYIHSIIREYSTYYTIENNKNIKVVEKGEIKNARSK